ncbi:hypothetical protein MSG28_016096, partial [Choristoneura fumiferana]
MRRIKKHKIKEENLASSSSKNRVSEEHDLAYFIHDRVELMHQVFSVLKSKEIKSFAPECVRRLPTDDLQELCLEELLGISSKRLCAILDGAEPPSDTESSSQSLEHLETISLDSISSDEEILSQGSKKKKKHRHAKKKRRRKSKGSESEDKQKDAGDSRAARAGLTAEPAVEAASSDNEVEIKEEPAEVVEISSDEEKPDRTSTMNSNEVTVSKNTDPQTVTKKINNLVITVPQSKPTRKIRLKRQKPPESVAKDNNTTNNEEDKQAETAAVPIVSSNTDNRSKTVAKENNDPAGTAEAKTKVKKSKKKKKKIIHKEGSDQDEITLQLSDSEKMDLLEDLDAKNLDNVTSSDSSSDDDHQEKVKQQEEKVEGDTSTNKNENTERADSELVCENKKGTETEETNKDTEIRGFISNDNNDTVEMNDLPVIVDEVKESSETEKVTNEEPSKVDDKPDIIDAKCDEIVESTKERNEENMADEKVKSDGEISDRESSEVEASDVQQEIVCISDDEGKKRKKRRKIKSPIIVQMTIDDDDDDVYEILEISDDSSCYEVEGVSVLSKEPTAEEIEAFSARMDEIEIDREQTVITNETKSTNLNETCDVENVSWKDRSDRGEPASVIETVNENKISLTPVLSQLEQDLNSPSHLRITINTEDKKIEIEQVKVILVYKGRGEPELDSTEESSFKTQLPQITEFTIKNVTVDGVEDKKEGDDKNVKDFEAGVAFDVSNILDKSQVEKRSDADDKEKMKHQNEDAKESEADDAEEILMREIGNLYHNDGYETSLTMTLTDSFKLHQMRYSRSHAWEWTFHYITEGGSGAFRTLAAKFLSRQVAYEFYNKIKECVLTLKSRGDALRLTWRRVLLSQDTKVSLVYKCHACGLCFDRPEILLDIHLSKCSPDMKIVKTKCACGLVFDQYNFTHHCQVHRQYTALDVKKIVVRDEKNLDVSGMKEVFMEEMGDYETTGEDSVRNDQSNETIAMNKCEMEAKVANKKEFVEDDEINVTENIKAAFMKTVDQSLVFNPVPKYNITQNVDEEKINNHEIICTTEEYNNAEKEDKAKYVIAENQNTLHEIHSSNEEIIGSQENNTDRSQAVSSNALKEVIVSTKSMNKEHFEVHDELTKKNDADMGPSHIDKKVGKTILTTEEQQHRNSDTDVIEPEKKISYITEKTPAEDENLENITNENKHEEKITHDKIVTTAVNTIDHSPDTEGKEIVNSIINAQKINVTINNSIDNKDTKHLIEENKTNEIQEPFNNAVKEIKVTIETDDEKI